MTRNVAVAYILTVCKHSWFWLGIWVFYYLRFTDYAGIGLIETTLIITMTLTEIPTGAIADLFGKRLTMILALLLETAGAIWYAWANGMSDLLGSVVVMCIGGSLFSGTLEALVFDSLKEQKMEREYEKVIANITSIQLFTLAVSSILGGFLYAINYRLPFIANALFYGLGFVAAWFLIEPKIDTVTFSWRNYLVQTKQGFTQLFANDAVKKQSLLLLSVGLVVVIMDEMLNSFLGIEFGFSQEIMGILWAAIFVLAALMSKTTTWLLHTSTTNGSVLLVGILMALTMVVSPAIGLLLGGLTLVVRSGLQAILGNLTSVAINQSTDSRYRATTLSTFNMIKNIPYVLGAYAAGSLSNAISAKTTTMWLGLALIILLGYQWLTTNNWVRRLRT